MNAFNMDILWWLLAGYIAALIMLVILTVAKGLTWLIGRMIE